MERPKRRTTRPAVAPASVTNRTVFHVRSGRGFTFAAVAVSRSQSSQFRVRSGHGFAFAAVAVSRSQPSRFHVLSRRAFVFTTITDRARGKSTRFSQARGQPGTRKLCLRRHASATHPVFVFSDGNGKAHRFNPEEESKAGKEGGASIATDRAHMASIGQRGGQAKPGYRERQDARRRASHDQGAG